jgi:O-antigen ligase
VTTQPMDDVTRRRAAQGSIIPGLGIGLLCGIAVIYIFGQETRFAVYGLGAVLAIAFLPGVVRLAGSLERLLFILLVLALQLDVAVAFRYREFKPAGAYGILISPILGVAAILFVLRVLLSARRLGPRLSIDGRLVRWTGLLFLAGVLSTVNTPDRQLVSFGLFEIFSVGLIAAVTADQCRTRDGLRVVQRMLAWTLVIQSILIIVSFSTGVQISLSHGVRGDDYGWAQVGRFAGTLNTPSAAGTMLVVCLLGALTRLYQSISVRERLWLYVQLGLGSFALLLTQTRTAWIAFILGGVGVLGAAVRRGELQAQRLVTLAGGAVVSCLAAWPFIASRVEANHSDDAEVRWRLITIAKEMIKAHPFAGIGLNTGTSQVYSYAAKAGTDGWVFIVHNQFLLAWAEMGLLGILATIWLFRVALQGAARLKRSHDVELRNAGLWLFWSLISLIWALNMDHVAGAPTYKLVFFVFGVAVGAARLAQPAEGAATGAAPGPGGPTDGARASAAA